MRDLLLFLLVLTIAYGQDRSTTPPSGRRLDPVPDQEDTNVGALDCNRPLPPTAVVIRECLAPPSPIVTYKSLKDREEYLLGYLAQHITPVPTLSSDHSSITICIPLTRGVDGITALYAYLFFGYVEYTPDNLPATKHISEIPKKLTYSNHDICTTIAVADLLNPNNGWGCVNYDPNVDDHFFTKQCSFVLQYKGKESDSVLLQASMLLTYILTGEGPDGASVEVKRKYVNYCDCTITQKFALNIELLDADCTNPMPTFVTIGDSICLRLSVSESVVQDYYLAPTTLYMLYPGGTAKEVDISEGMYGTVQRPHQTDIKVKMLITGNGVMLKPTVLITTQSFRRRLSDEAGGSQATEESQKWIGTGVTGTTASLTIGSAATNSGSTITMSAVYLALALIVVFL